MASSSFSVLFILSALFLSATSTSFNVVNRCSSSIDVVIRQNPGPSIGDGFNLSPGASRAINAPDGWGGNFGLQTPSLLAEFSINSNAGNDFYDLSAVDGFQLDRGMRIEGADPVVSCSASRSICPGENIQGSACVSPNRDDPNTNYVRAIESSCGDAYSWSKDDTATHGTPTGKTFTIIYCP